MFLFYFLNARKQYKISETIVTSLPEPIDYCALRFFSTKRIPIKIVNCASKDTNISIVINRKLPSFQALIFALQRYYEHREEFFVRQQNHYPADEYS